MKNVVRYVLAIGFIGLGSIQLYSALKPEPTIEVTVGENPQIQEQSIEERVENAPTQQENAAKSAQGYVDLMSFSRKEVIERLLYDGFSEELAIYGTDNCNADWNNECLESALNFVEFFSMSTEELRSQLTSSGFTESEIEFAISNLGY